MAVSLSSKNLVVNSGVETGPVSTDFFTNTPPQGWTTTGSFTGVTYSAGGGADLNSDRGQALQGGTAYFAGGQGGAISTAAQMINVSAYAAGIDAGKLSADLSGQLGGYAGQHDSMSLSATFLAADGVTILGEISLSGPDPAGRQSQTTLLLEQQTDLIPVGTRSIEIMLTATRLEGSFNDGYADNIGLHLLGTNAGLVSVLSSHSFVADVIQPATGIVFNTDSTTTATFASTQFGAGQIALGGTVEGSSNVDILKIAVADGATFLAGQFKFSNWTSGADLVAFTGGAGNSATTGTSQDDSFAMGGGSDSVNGGAGNDLIDGNAGRDVLRGGLGADDFVLASSANSRDRITDFTLGDDHLLVSVARFGLTALPGSALGAAFVSNATGLAEGVEDRFIYNTATGTLYFDADGTGTGFSAQAIALLSAAPLLSDTDFLLIA